jgi:hypothetical protein
MTEEFPWDTTERELANHSSFEAYIQRMPIKHWRKILLDRRDVVVYRGHHRQLIAKNIGAGVVEVSKKPLDR